MSTRKDVELQKLAAKNNPGQFHGDIAKGAIYWFDQGLNAWIKQINHQWVGFDAKSGEALKSIDLPLDYNPWTCAFDDSQAPFYRWFDGGFTNACFNEVDVHLMNGRGKEIALIFEGDRWDPSLNHERGGPVVLQKISRRQLFWEVAKYALVLKDLGLKKGDRIVLNMPNILEQIYYIEAAKRLGIIYSPVFGGFSAKTLSDRIQDAGAKVVITADGAHRNAQVVAFKEVYTDKALDDYIPALDAVNKLQNALKQIPETKTQSHWSQHIIQTVQKALEGEITIERSDAMQAVGRALEEIKEWDSATKSKVRTRLAEALVLQDPRVLTTVVVQHTKNPDLLWNSARDQWSHDLLQKASQKILKGLNESELASYSDKALIALVYAHVPPLPLESEFPMFIIYTSGSTGKPKGVVHTQGGYLSGIANTMRTVFGVNPEKKSDVIYVVADPGWITGQSYMISAALTTGTTSIITEGSPLFPNAGRFASIIERYGVTIFKAGSTFLKAIAANPEHIADVKKYDCSTLKIGTFCAEPTNPSIQAFAMDLLTPNYINSYWATEHGGMILSHLFDNKDFPLQADAHTRPLPWVFTEVWLPTENGGHRLATGDEKGEIVITAPYPYLLRTLWGDADNVGKASWQGDFERFRKVYFDRWDVLAYTQGDFASQNEDGSLSLHGRSDDVINTSGHRIGTAEIEGAILKDKQNNPNSVVGNAIVVGAPHEEKGTVPLAFILTHKGKALSMEDEKRLIALIREEKGAVAVPAGFIAVSQFPETQSGKYMRRYLMRLLEGQPLGDTSTLRNPESLKEIASSIKQWQQKMALKENETILELLSTLRVEYHEIIAGQSLAIVTVDNPPVNALNERALDELNTVIDHLARRPDIKVLIITGAGTKSFVAGADIRQFLEEMHSVGDVQPLSHKAAIATRTLESMNKPVIAAINGLALGGGNEFQMAATYRVAEPTARFGQPEINLHLIPGYGGTQRLPRLLCDHLGYEGGFIEAADLILGGRTIDAKTAQGIGLINEVCEDHDALSRAVILAKDYILHPTTSQLKKSLKSRRQANKQWEKPQTFPDSFLAHPEIKRLIKQARLAGRTHPASLALKAMRFGFEHGLTAGIEKEAQYFAKMVIDPHCGKIGIQAFFDKKSAPLPTRQLAALSKARDQEAVLLQTGELLPHKSPFYPGVTTIPAYQYAHLVERDPKTGLVNHGDPITAEIKRIIPVSVPKAEEALLYMLTSEINFNDIWAITGVPVSTFDEHEEDWHVTGSGGLALVAAIGRDMKDEGRIKVGDLVAVFSGQSQLLSPIAGLDPMFADQKIQGYQTPDGSHQQFMIAQGPQLFHALPDLSLEAAGSYMLNLGTIYRALYTTLKIESGKTLFIEGAATGTGLEAVKAAARQGLDVTGLVSSPDRAEVVREHGGIATINRTDAVFKNIYTKVPQDPADWAKWEQAGEALLDAYRHQNQGKLADYAISHAGETSFPRSFQLLNTGGILTFYGASLGYHFTFMGKSGCVPVDNMLRQAHLQNGENVLIYYGSEPAKLDKKSPISSAQDLPGLECIEAAKEIGANIVVCTRTDAQKEFVKSMGFSKAIKGVFSLEEIRRREGDAFSWPDTMPPLPDPKLETEAFKEAVRWYQEHVFKPFASQVGGLLKTAGGGRGVPDLIIERAGQDTLALSSMLVKPYTGRVVYFENMHQRRYSFYAPQVWMRQRRIIMPTASIYGTHLSNSYEIQAMNGLINSGYLSVDDPLVIDFAQLPTAHQEMWENKHRASNYVLNHALPQPGLKSKDDLYYAWSIASKSSQPEGHAHETKKK